MALKCKLLSKMLTGQQVSINGGKEIDTWIYAYVILLTLFQNDLQPSILMEKFILKSSTCGCDSNICDVRFESYLLKSVL